MFKHFNINVFVFIFMGTVTVLSNMFMCCYLGKLASDSYKQIADSIYQSNWYELIVDLQKFFIMMIANAHIPRQYHGYGLVTLNLEAFCKVGTNTIVFPLFFFEWFMTMFLFLAYQIRFHMLHVVQDHKWFWSNRLTAQY